MTSFHTAIQILLLLAPGAQAPVRAQHASSGSPLAVGVPEVTNVGVAAYHVPVDGAVLAVGVLEFEEGQDLDGDGDTQDQVLHLYEHATGSLTNLGMAHEAVPAVEGRWVVFAAYELPMQTDLNGDGDLADDVPHVYDRARGTLWNGSAKLPRLVRISTATETSSTASCTW